MNKSCGLASPSGRAYQTWVLSTDSVVGAFQNRARLVGALLALSKTINHELILSTGEYKQGPARSETVYVFDYRQTGLGRMHISKSQPAWSGHFGLEKEN